MAGIDTIEKSVAAATIPENRENFIIKILKIEKIEIIFL